MDEDCKALSKLWHSRTEECKSEEGHKDENPFEAFSESIGIMPRLIKVSLLCACLDDTITDPVLSPGL